MRKLVLLGVLAAAIAACSDRPAPPASDTPVVANKPPAADPPVVTTPPVSTEGEPMPEFEIPERVTRLMATPTGAKEAAGPPIKVDASTPESFLQSLQAIERAATKEKVDHLRGALTVLQFQTEKRVAAIAAKQSTPPQFTDQQLMQLAFGEIHGMTADQVIAHARKVAVDVVPVK